MYLPVFHTVFRAAGALPFNSEWERARAQRLHGIDTHAMPVAGLGMALQAPEALAQSGVLARHGLSAGYLVCVGRLAKAKGCKELITAFMTHLQSHPDAQLVLVGKAMMAVPGRLRMACTGFASDTERNALNAGAAAPVVPSRCESLSMVLLEAMLLRVPVIANPGCQVLTDHVQCSGAGVAYRGRRGLVRALAQLAEAPSAKRLLWGQRAEACVRSRYHRPRVLQLFNDAIERVCNEPGPAGGGGRPRARSLHCAPMKERHIGISLGNMGALNDGLGEFSLQIGARLAAIAPAWRAQHGIRVHFHLREKLFGLFGNDVAYIAVNRWQRLRHVQPEPFALWHSLHQLSKNLPPNMEAGGTRLVTVHDLNYLYGPNAFSRWRHHRRSLKLMARTDHVVAISRHTAGDVKRALGWAGPMEVIYNGARCFVAAERVPLSGWAAVAERPFLYHLSRMSPSKNPQAVLGLAREWPEMTFVLCGPPSDDAKALKAANRQPNVEFHLGISDAQKAWAYANCAGFLFPSLTEGFGLPPIEAMYCGKPVFLARRTSLPEIGGDAASYFDSFEPQAMKAVVQQGLLRQAEPGRPEAVRQHAAQFNWDGAASAYLALYRRLLGLPG